MALILRGPRCFLYLTRLVNIESFGITPTVRRQLPFPLLVGAADGARVSVNNLPASLSLA